MRDVHRSFVQTAVDELYTRLTKKKSPYTNLEEHRAATYQTIQFTERTTEDKRTDAVTQSWLSGVAAHKEHQRYLIICQSGLGWQRRTGRRILGDSWTFPHSPDCYHVFMG